MMKKRKLFWIVSILFVICIVIILGIVLSKPSELSLEEQSIKPTGKITEVSLEGSNVVGFFTGLNTEENGVYLANDTPAGQVQISYQSLTDVNREPVLVHTSEHVCAAYKFYALDGDSDILFLELYYDESQDLAFRLIQIGLGDSYDNVDLLYQAACERMPYIAVVDLTSSSDIEGIHPRVLLNYDNEGDSRLILLHRYAGAGNEPTVISSGIYGHYDEGAIESGRRIVFAGGYGDYIYYQALYNSVGDPPPEVATFEAIGTPVLFRYNVRTEEINRVTELEQIALHINATQNYALVSEYDYDVPLMDSGKLISLGKEQTDYIIPGVESGADICESRFIEEDKVVFYTSKILYFADIDKGVLHTYSLDDNVQVWLGRESVRLVHSGSEQAKIECMDYSEVFDAN